MKKYFVLFSICFLAVFSLASCGSGSDFTADQKQQMENIVNAKITQYNIPGVIAAVWVPNTGTWIKTFGSANTATGEAMSSGMSFRIASISKTFIATIALQLQEEGLLDLDDTLDKYITSPAVPNANIITLRQLANMSSGLFDYTDDEEFDALQTADPLREWTPAELVEFGIRHEPYFAPGTSYHYSNTNFILLGMIIESVTGNSVQEEVSARIAEPLKLPNTYLATQTTMPEYSSHGYKLGGDGSTIQDITTISPSYAGSAGAIISNINELKTWVEALGKGTLITPESHDEQFTWVDEPDSPITKYGLGVMKVGNFIGHEGHIDGFNSVAMYLPSNGAVIVVMQNLNPSATAGIAGTIFANIAKVVLPNDVSW